MCDGIKHSDVKCPYEKALANGNGNPGNNGIRKPIGNMPLAARKQRVYRSDVSNSPWYANRDVMSAEEREELARSFEDMIDARKLKSLGYAAAIGTAIAAAPLVARAFGYDMGPYVNSALDVLGPVGTFGFGTAAMYPLTRKF